MGGAPYREQRVTVPDPPSRWRSWARRVALGGFALALSWSLGGYVHLPWRARALCGSSADVGESFSPRAFRFRAVLLGLTLPGERAVSTHERAIGAMGTWVFLRCSCTISHREGRVVQKRLFCFD